MDILIVAFLIYAVLLLVKRTHSVFILGGILILVFIYLAARFLNFYLTGLILQSFFASFIVILVVIFQKELRNFFEWLSTSGRARLFGRKKAILEITGDKIVRTAEYLADHKIGGLIVLPGIQPLERLLEGGMVLDGKVSAALLLSLFDPSSPGHDGAVVIEGDRISRFSVHLPLAAEFRKFGNLGTRHRAALGLAQSSDALVVVVSEERGIISVAHDGGLKPLSGAGELKKELEKFFKKEEILEGEPWWRKWLVKNFREKIIAGCLAVFLWLIFVFQFGVINQEFKVPVEFRFLPGGLMVDQVNPKEIVLTLGGRSQDFRLFNAGNDLRVLIDSSDFGEGARKITIQAKYISHPDTLSIVSFTPKTIQIHIRKTGE